MTTLKNKVILITGGSSGIGKALVEESLRRGARVATCGRNLQKLQQVFGHTGSEHLLMTETDVSDDVACSVFVQSAISAFGQIDVLINNAGISMRALFKDTDLSVLRELMDINFWGTVQCTKYALPFLLQSNGVVVGISSIAGYRGLPARTGYSASKFAVQGFLESLRTELLYSGTHVMWVSPGFTSSNIRNVALAADGTTQAETPLDEYALMSAESCAERILDAVIARKRTVVMTRQGKLAVWVSRFFPGFADGQVYRHFKNEPGSPLKG